MNQLQELQALQDAAAILEAAKTQTACGTIAVFRRILHAKEYVSSRAETLLRDGDEF